MHYRMTHDERIAADAYALGVSVERLGENLQRFGEAAKEATAALKSLDEVMPREER